jgi:dTDP-4-amino-4,6-dideoxygalactose transaminase
MKNIPFAKPDITEREVAEVAETLRSGWVTTGPRSKEFERRFAERVGARHAVAVNSCTAAMHLALEALGVGPGDEVIAPTMTFAATGEVVRYMGAKPVLVDVLDGDHNIDPAALEAAITDKTKAIIPVHFGGQAAEMDAICAIAKKHGLKVVEDAAHAFPARYGERRIGSIGDVTCFSFYATKPITTGEGGMAVTGDERIAERMRVMSLHGISKDAWKRYTSEGSWYYEIVAPGYKYNMGDLAAAMGLVQLERAHEMLEKRREIARAYTEAFGGLDSVELLDVRDFDAHAWHLFVLKLVEGEAALGRDELIEELKKRGVGTSVHFIPLHMHPYYRETWGHAPEDLPVALDLYRRSISLPIYSAMSDEHAAAVIDAVRELVASHRR